MTGLHPDPHVSLDLARKVEGITSHEDGYSFPLPPDCLRCRKFDALFDVEALPGEVMTRRADLLIGFRYAHHRPEYVFVDRGEYFLRDLAKAKWPADLRRAIARLVAISDEGA